MKYLLTFVLLFFTSAVEAKKFKLPKQPWINAGATAYLKQHLMEHKNAKVLEFGSGASTVWFCKHTNNVTSIEHSKHFIELVKKQLTPKQRKEINYIYHPLPYYSLTNQFVPNTFDIILVDGRDRVKCLEGSIPLLKSGGVMMLDDAERSWYKEAYTLLKEWPLYSAKRNRKNMKPKETNWWIKP